MLRIVGAFALAAAIALPGDGSAAYGKNRQNPQPQAEAIQDRYCLQGRRWGYPGNCQFSTYAQCMATASGTIDSCGLNPTYAFREWKGPR
ncbi:DUF3551 domain-containing protein [Bradyrhizobium sp. LVM 105]|uniref:DUF3551 domain-containing protein n=1 Tax=Bradyrhizobium sp. LVM 105 TaxID=2341115 RepID=UPI000F7FDE72|nr:DUF3551 domain-containing protein [Bradyrhizobium sp. LVM 105]RTE91601.1 DUF3551 domain-containing protein [Bradyrhizobium sp. LVM 105]